MGLDLPLIGLLRQRIMVARRSREPDPDFGFVETMTLTAELWAHVEYVKEGVGYLGDATDAPMPTVTHHFTVRRDPVVNMPDSRTYVIHQSRRYKVLRVREEDPTGRFICLLCAAQETGANGPDVPGWVLESTDGSILISFP